MSYICYIAYMDNTHLPLASWPAGDARSNSYYYYYYCYCCGRSVRSSSYYCWWWSPGFSGAGGDSHHQHRAERANTVWHGMHASSSTHAYAHMRMVPPHGHLPYAMQQQQQHLLLLLRFPLLIPFNSPAQHKNANVHMIRFSVTNSSRPSTPTTSTQPMPCPCRSHLRSTYP